MSKIVADTIEDLAGANSVPVAALGIGVNQSWQDVTGSRAVSVTYTNTTDKSISVLCVVGDVVLTSVDLEVGGIVAARDSVSSGDRATLVALVPSGTTYKVSATGGSILYMAELRETP